MLERKLLFEGKHVRLLEKDGWEFVERKTTAEAVAVIAETNAGEIILTEQFRKPVNARVIDWPAGLVGDDGGSDDPAATAKKELFEETGFECGAVTRLAGGPSSPGIASEIVTFYRAEHVEKRGAGGGVGSENITVHIVPRTGIREWLAHRETDGGLIDLKIWGGLYFLERGE